MRKTMGKKLTKRGKYLGLRLFMVLELAYFGVYKGMLVTENVTPNLFLNTLLLFYLPLFVEYLFGFDTYSSITNKIKYVGLFFSGIGSVFCVLGFMDDLEVGLNLTNHLVQFTIFGSPLPI